MLPMFYSILVSPIKLQLLSCLSLHSYCPPLSFRNRRDISVLADPLKRGEWRTNLLIDAQSVECNHPDSWLQQTLGIRQSFLEGRWPI